MLEERELIRRLIAGDKAAEEEFLQAYRARLTRACLCILGTHDREAAGIVRETLRTAQLKLKERAFYTPIYAWLRQLCQRLSYARLRARGRLLQTIEEDA